MAEGQDHLDKELDKALNDMAGGHKPAIDALNELMEEKISVTISPNTPRTITLRDFTKYALECAKGADVGMAGGTAVPFAFSMMKRLKKKMATGH